jgi:hypothetical protein
LSIGTNDVIEVLFQYIHQIADIIPHE